MIPLARNSRFSLSRPNLNAADNKNGPLQPASDADETFEDASGGETSETGDVEEGEREHSEPATATTSRHSPTPPPPNATARSVRAYCRAKMLKK